MKQGEKQFVEQQLANQAARSPSTSGGKPWSRFLPATKYDLIKLKQYIDMKTAEIAAALTAIAAQEAKVFTELRTRLDAQQASIDDLTKKLNDAELPPEAAAALADVQTKTQALDDIIPDAPPVS